MLLNIRFNSILQSTPRSSKWPLSFTFPRQNLTRISLSSHTCLMTCPSYHDRHVILLGRGKIYQVPHYTVLVCDHSKSHKVPCCVCVKIDLYKEHDLWRFSYACCMASRATLALMSCLISRKLKVRKSRCVAAISPVLFYPQLKKIY